MFAKIRPLLSNHLNLILLPKEDKEFLLQMASKEGIFVRAKVIDDSLLHFIVDPSYDYYLKDIYGYNPLFSSKLNKYFENLYFSSSYLNEKIENGKKIVKELIDHNLISIPSLDWMKNYTIYIYHLNVLPPLFLRTGFEYSVINDESHQATITRLPSLSYQDSLYEVANSVIRKVLEGVPLENIELWNVSNQDYYHLLQYFSDANLPLYYHRASLLINYPLAIEFIQSLENETVKNAYEKIKVKAHTDLDFVVLKTIATMINQVPEDLIRTHPEIFLYHFRNNTYRNEEYVSSIHLYPEEVRVTEPNQDIFVLNFVDQLFPALEVDDEYFSDEEKILMNALPSFEKNQEKLSKAKYLLSEYQNLTVFSYEKNGKLVFDLPDLELEYQTALSEVDAETERYIHAMSLLHLGYAYKTYIPQFSGIFKDTLNTLLDYPFYISQTSLQKYIECPFHYLLSSVLRLEPKQTSVHLYYGNLVHKMLELSSKGQIIDFDELIRSLEKDIPSEEEYKFAFFNDILKDRLPVILDKIQGYQFNNRFEPIMSEQSFKVPSETDSRFVLIGKIDQIYLYQAEDKKYIVIVDYKTGKTKYDHDKIRSIEQIQLLMYYYLFLHYYNQEEYDIVGLYYQQAHIPLMSREDLEKENFSFFSYDGITVDYRNTVYQMIDEVSIRGIQKTKEGFRETKRLFSLEEMKQIYHSFETELDEMTKKISIGDFRIAPKPIAKGKKISESCEYCPFKNICFLQSQQLVDFDEDEIEEGEESED